MVAKWDEVGNLVNCDSTSIYKFLKILQKNNADRRTPAHD